MASQVINKEQEAQFQYGEPTLSDEASVRPAQASKDNRPRVPSASLTSTSQSMKKFATTNSSQHMISSPVTTAATAIPHLQDLLRNVNTQRDQVLKLINTIDPTYLVRSDPRWMEEHKLRTKITELQAKILALSEEVNLTKIKNAQLEHQLCSFYKKDEWRAVS